MIPTCRRLLRAAVLVAWAAALLPAASQAARDPQDQVFTQVGVDERSGQSVPLGLPFRDQNGRLVRLGDYFTGAPVIVSLNYYACPTLCPLVFRNLADTIGGLSDLKLSRDFRIVTVSINPEESPALAREKSATTYGYLKKVPDPAARWPFLMGNRDAIDSLAQGVGVRFLRQGPNDFAHPNVLVVLTPDGRISRYLYGLQVSPRDLRLALLEAAGGNIGTSQTANRILLYCFHYDPVGKKYVLFASRLMTVAMLTVLALMAGLLAVLYKRERTPQP